MSVLELKIYFEGDTHNVFEKLLEGFLSINNKLMDLYSEKNEHLLLIQKSNEFHSFKDKTLIENEVLLTLLCKEIRQIYKS